MQNKSIKINGDKPFNETIFTTCDSKYFINYAEGFLNSIAKLKSKNVHIHIINPLKKNIEDVVDFKERYKSVSSYSLTVSFEETLLGENKDKNKTYYASSRFLLQDFFAISKCLIVDIDSLFIRDFDFCTNELGLTIDLNKPVPTAIKAGCFYFTSNAKEFLQFNNKLLAHLIDKGYGWFADQLSLYVTYQKYKDDFNIYKFEKGFMSKKISDNPTILTNQRIDEKTISDFDKLYSNFIKL